MTKSDRVLAVAHHYAERWFHPAPLSAIDVEGSGISLGSGYESWLVRVVCKHTSLVVTVVIGPDGHAEVTQHTLVAA